MINVSDELKQAFLDGSTTRNMKLEFSDGTEINGSEILAGSFSMKQTLTTEEQMNFGQVGSASFEITVLKSNHEYKGLGVTVTMYAGTYSLKLGEFIVEEDVLSDNRLQRKLTAYDAIYSKNKMDVSSWYEGLTFPLTQKAFRDSLFAYVGITQETVTLPNDSITVEQAIDTTKTALTFKTVIKQLCEINACFGCLNNNGNFRYIFINQFGRTYPSDDLYPQETGLYPSDGVFESISTSGDGAVIKQGTYIYKGYMCDRIDKVTIRETDTDVGTSYGIGTNEYIIEGNIFCIGNSATKNRQIATNFYGVAHDSTYKPAAVTTQAMPWLEPGDLISVVGKDGTSSVFPIFDRTLSGITSAMDTYLANGNKTRTANVNSFSSQLRQVKSQTLTLSADISEVKSQLNVIADDYVTSATLQQSISGASAEIELSVENSYSKKAEIIANINGTQQSEVKIHADKISLEGAISANGTFKIDTDGNMECTSGKLGNWVISSKGIYNNSLNFAILSDVDLYAAAQTGTSSRHVSGVLSLGPSSFNESNNRIDVSDGAYYFDSEGFLSCQSLTVSGYSSLQSVGATSVYCDSISVRNGGNGTIFSTNPSGGIRVQNGIVTSFGISGYSGSITYGGLRLTYTQGLLTSVTNV